MKTTSFAKKRNGLIPVLMAGIVVVTGFATTTLGDFCAFTVNHYDERPEYIDTVYFGEPGSVKSVDISFGEMSQPPDQSLQITEKYIYYFS